MLNASNFRIRVTVFVGSDSETVGVAVVIGYKKFGLTIVAILDLRHGVAELLQAFSDGAEVVWRPVEPDAVIVLRSDRRSRALIEPEINMLIVNHAADESVVLPHRAVHRETKAFHPETQAPFEVRTWNDWNARFQQHSLLPPVNGTILHTRQSHDQTGNVATFHPASRHQEMRSPFPQNVQRLLQR